MSPSRALIILALLCACEAPVSDHADDGLDRHPIVGACLEDMSQETASDPFADCVDEFIPEGGGFGEDALPGIVLGPPEAGADGNAGVDVLSLGCGGQVTLSFAGAGIPDGPGPDLLVFENPFMVGEGSFAEPARVLVSDDGVDWRAFPCEPGSADLRGCAGVAVVRANSHNGLDPTDPAQAGGDAFDLAELGLTRARHVRIIDVGRDHDPSGLWCAGPGGGFDLDALAAVHAP